MSKGNESEGSVGARFRLPLEILGRIGPCICGAF
jgi:hypothetical protein